MLQIDDQVPGGNVIVDRVEGDTVYLRPDPRDSVEWWFYFSFRVRGAGGRTLRFQFDRDPMTCLGPAVSYDAGANWAWHGMEEGEAAFVCTFGSDDEVRFAMGLPYLQSHLDAFLQGCPEIRRDVLCRTDGGREVELLRIDATGPATARLLVTARHHCCESSAGYAIEGLLDALRSSSRPSGLEVIVVPFMDKDGVEDGDQGKHRRGRDHNRDYGEPSQYVEVQAIKRVVCSLPRTDRFIALDLHCPFLRGQWNEQVYMVGSEDPAVWVRQQALSRALARRCLDGLRHFLEDDLPYGQSWNVPANFGPHTSCSRWMHTTGGAELAGTIEIPYALVHGETVTPANLRELGGRLAHAFVEWVGAQGSEKESTDRAGGRI